jgi:cyclophilin family peptidyl-prolyl cis-trans isomerase
MRRFALVALLVGLMVNFAGFGQEQKDGKKGDKQKDEKKADPKDGKKDDQKDDKQDEKKEDVGPVVVLETSMGPIKVMLFEKKAPVTVKNFLDYVDEKYYDGTVIHRVVEGFIQGGGYTSGLKLKEKGLHGPIKNESDNGLSNVKYTIAMARISVFKNDKAGGTKPDSATSQFYINVKDNTFLDRDKMKKDPAGHCVFGKVVEGTAIVDKMAAVKTTTRNEMENAPVQDLVIKSIRRLEPPPVVEDDK